MKPVTLPEAVPAERLYQALTAGQDVRLLDVRTPTEFAWSRLSGSHNVPLDQLEVHAATIRGASAPVVIVCRSDARARAARDLLRRQGMKNVHVLEGGLVAWRGTGLPVTRDPVSPGAALRRLMGVAGIALAAFYARQNPGLALVLGFLGLRMAMGLSAMPCAVAGTCAAPRADAASSVRAIVDGGKPTQHNTT